MSNGLQVSLAHRYRGRECALVIMGMAASTMMAAVRPWMPKAPYVASGDDRRDQQDEAGLTLRTPQHERKLEQPRRDVADGLEAEHTLLRGEVALRRTHQASQFTAKSMPQSCSN